VLIGLAGATVAAAPKAPKPPPGLLRCETPLAPSADLPRTRGEQLTYDLELLGLSLGQASVTTWDNGLAEGQAVTEYRAWITPDPLVSALLPLSAQAFALVPQTSTTPVRSRTRYSFRADRVAEDQVRDVSGRALTSTREKNGRSKTQTRAYAVPTLDYLSAFLLLRRLPPNAAGCTVIYGEQQAYTVWLNSEGVEWLDTADGKKPFERYLLRYGSAKSKKVETARVWMTTGSDRVPYRAEGRGAASPRLQLSSHRLPG
jgi:hypothetical protein